MPTSLVVGEIADSIPEHFRPVWHQIRSDLLQDESVFFAAYSSRQVWNDNQQGKGLLAEGKVTTFPFLLVLTGFRWIRGHFYTGPTGDMFHAYDSTVVYRKEGGRFLSFNDLAEWRWCLPPKKPLPRRAKISLTEMPLAKIEVNSRRDYPVTIDGEKLDLVEIELANKIWYTLLKPDGDLLYELLQIANQNRGILTGSTVTTSIGSPKQPEVIQSLEKLVALYQAGVLTQDEFERLKRRLIS